jgi:hypothetical protein
MKKFKTSIIQLLCLPLIAISVQAQSPAMRFRAAAVTDVARAVVTKEVVCMNCILVTFESEETHAFVYGDQFASNEQGTRSKFVLASRIANSAPTFIEPGSGMRSCGGTSNCHAEYRYGECHVQCEGQEQLALQASVRRSAREGSVPAIAQLLQTSNGKVRLNIERSALQILGCDGAVAMHFPISASFTASVSSALDVLRAAEH